MWSPLDEPTKGMGAHERLVTFAVTPGIRMPAVRRRVRRTGRRGPCVETACASAAADAPAGRGSCGTAGRRPRGWRRHCWRCRGPGVQLLAPLGFGGRGRGCRSPLRSVFAYPTRRATDRLQRPTSGRHRGDRPFVRAVVRSSHIGPALGRSGSPSIARANRSDRRSGARAGSAWGALCHRA